MASPSAPLTSLALHARRLAVVGVLLAALVALATPARAGQAEDLAAARALFDGNLAAIQHRDRETYLACYLRGDGLVRTGFTGPERGFDGLVSSLTDDWPVTLEARDVHLQWLSPGLVYGTYRYRVIYADGVAHEGLSERLFQQMPDGWRIVVTTAFEQPAGTPAPPVALLHATCV